MRRTLIRATIVAAASVLAVSAVHLSARSGPEGTRTLYLSVLDESGKPVKDFTADEIRMREDGKDVQIISVGPARDPLQVVLLVDTSDSAVRLTQDIRRGVMAFIKQLHGVRSDAAIQLMEFGQAAVPTTPFTTDDEVLSKSLDHMVGKPTADAVMLEAMQQAAIDLAKRPSPRRAVVAFNAEPSRELVGDTNKLNEAFRKSVAQFWAVSLQLSDVSYGAAAGADGRTSAAMGSSALRNAALTQIAQLTGGDREAINSPVGIESQLKQFADALSYQYEIVYRSNAKSPKVVQVGTTRQGVKLHASGFAPQ